MNEKSWDGSEGQVDVGFENQHNGRLHERLYTVKKTGPKYYVAHFSVSAEHGGDLDIVKVDGPKTLDEKYKRRISLEGEIKEIEYTPETTDSLKSELEELTEDLISDGRKKSRVARERLIKIGKPAIPAILNQIVPLDFTSEDDLGKTNKCVSALRIITGRTFGFSPAMLESAVNESTASDFQISIKRWFGWWERNHKTWKGRDIEKEMEDW